MKCSWLLHVLSTRRLGWLQVGLTLVSFVLLLLECCLSPWEFKGVSWKFLEWVSREPMSHLMGAA